MQHGYILHPERLASYLVSGFECLWNLIVSFDARSGEGQRRHVPERRSRKVIHTKRAPSMTSIVL